MMEAVAIFSLVATSAQVVKLCYSTAEGIHSLHVRQKDAQASLVAIRQECNILAAFVESINAWAETPAAKRRERQCASLDVALGQFIPSLQAVSDDVERLLKYTRKDGSLTSRGRLKYLWGEDRQKAHLESLRWQSGHVGRLLQAISLYVLHCSHAPLESLKSSQSRGRSRN
jgi:hypothetical protein